MQPKSSFKILFVLLICLLVSGAIKSQSDTLVNKITFIVYPELLGNITLKKGFLYQILDSSIIITKVQNKFHLNNYPIFKPTDSISPITIQSSRWGCSKCPLYQAINYKILENILVRKKYNTGKGILLGGLTGLVLGTIGAIIVRQSTPDVSSIAGIIIVPIGLGILTGSIIGSIKSKIPIHGSFSQFEKYRSKLKRHAKIKY